MNPDQPAASGTAPVAELERRVFDQAAALGRALRGCGWRVATAESCTGGLVARALTEIGGSSDWFERGFVTYGNAAKSDLLGVSPATLQAEGAVSETVAREMAEGALSRSRSQLALAITGIAGPGGAVPGKPVGTVCFGWAAIETAPCTETRHFSGDRAAVRAQAAHYALQRAAEWLSELEATLALNPRTKD
ncbi:MAG: CinA family protein [Burkholderiaceae bacterium]